MKKKGWIISGCMIVIVLLAVAGLYLQGEIDGKQEKETAGYINNASDEEPEENFSIKSDLKSRMVVREEGDIIWTISDDAWINEEYLKLFNEKLKKEGYGFQLKFQYLDTEHYDEEVREILKNGDTDIALGGQNSGYSNIVAKLCRDGLLLDISKHLESEACKPLLEEYEEPLWKSVSVDGKIYTIPNGIYEDGRFCVVFNNQYISQKEIDKFTGDVTRLEEFLTDEFQKNPKGKKLLFTWNGNDVASVLGYSYKDYGVFFEAASGEISSPFECDRLKQFLTMLNAFQEAGCVPEQCSLRGMGVDQTIQDMIQNKEFGILLTKRSDILNPIMSDVTIVDLDFLPNFARVGGTNGICAKSQNAKEAMQLLTLLHTNDEYAHLLLYGEEGKDYTVEDGKIVSDDYTQIGTVDILGIFRSSYPDNGESVYTGNIRQQKREIYRSSHCKTSAAAGFQIDETAFTDEELDVADTSESYFDIWKEKDFEKKYQEAREETEKVEKSIISKLEKQWEAWKEKSE